METPQDDNQAAEHAPPLTAFQQLGRLAAEHGVYPEDLPVWMQTAYLVIDQFGEAREMAGRELGMNSVAEVLCAESAIAGRIIRKLSEDGQELEEVRALRQALKAEGEKLADVKLFAERKVAIVPPAPDPPSTKRKQTATGTGERHDPPPKAGSARHENRALRRRSRSVLRDIDALFARNGVDPAVYLAEHRLQRAYALFVSLSKGEVEIMQELKSSKSASELLETLLSKLAQNASEVPGLTELVTRKPGKWGYLRTALRDVDALFMYRHVDPADFLSGKYLTAYTALVTTDRDANDIVRELGYKPGRKDAVQSRIMEQLRRRAAHLLGFPEPADPSESSDSSVPPDSSDIEKAKPESYADQPGTEKAWAMSERLEVTRGISTLETEQKVDMATILSPTQLQAYRVLTNPDLSTKQIHAQVSDISPMPLRELNWRILNRIIEKVPPAILQLPERRRAAMARLMAEKKPGTALQTPGNSMRDALRQIDQILRGRTDSRELPETLLAGASELYKSAYPLLLDPQKTYKEIGDDLGANKDTVRRISTFIVGRFVKGAPHVLGFAPPPY